MKWALVTGATSGIGWATCLSLAESGYSILAVGRRAERLAELQKKLEASSHAIQFQSAVLDLSQKSAVGNFVEKNQDALKNLKVLVNNAGLAKGIDKIQDSDIADWDAMIDTNIKGLLYMTRAVLPFLIQQNAGHIVNIGSVAGRWTYPGGGVYCATKFAVRALTEGLRMDLLGTPIRVTNIEPGMVETEFSVVRLGDQNKANQVYENMKPLTPADIAETITWCVQRPGHVNIQELVIYPTDQAHVGQVARHKGSPQ